ncbi:MAG: hypothetical protein NVSMB32_02860 [Actinomycetota bacterium]
MLLPVAGRPFIDHKLAQLARQGAGQVVLLTGHGGDAIASHVGDGSRYGLSLSVIPDGEALLGTGGAVRRARRRLGDRFWVTYGDTLLAVPMGRVEEHFRASGRQGLMTVLYNRDAWDRSNVAVRDSRVIEYRKGAPEGSFDYIDYGMSILPAAAFDGFPEDVAFDLGAVIQSLIAEGELAAFVVQARFHEIGSEAGYREPESHVLGLRGDRTTP